MSTLGRSRSSKADTATEENPAEERTTSRGTRREAAKAGKSTRGWGAYGSIKRTNNMDDRLLNLEDGVERIIKFVDSEPFETYNQHFLNALPKGNKKSFVSPHDLDPDGAGCAICAEGDVPKTYSLFNVIDFGPLVEDDDEVKVKPTLKAWRASPTATEKIQRIANSKRTQPINKTELYFAVTANKNKSDMLMVDNIEPVKAGDLKDDMGISPLTDEQFEKLAAKAYESKEDVGVKEDSDEDIEEALAKLPATD